MNVSVIRILLALGTIAACGATAADAEQTKASEPTHSRSDSGDTLARLQEVASRYEQHTSRGKQGVDVLARTLPADLSVLRSSGVSGSPAVVPLLHKISVQAAPLFNGIVTREALGTLLALTGNYDSVRAYVEEYASRPALAVEAMNALAPVATPKDLERFEAVAKDAKARGMDDTGGLAFALGTAKAVNATRTRIVNMTEIREQVTALVPLAKGMFWVEDFAKEPTGFKYDPFTVFARTKLAELSVEAPDLVAQAMLTATVGEMDESPITGEEVSEAEQRRLTAMARNHVARFLSEPARLRWATLSQAESK